MRGKDEDSETSIRNYGDHPRICGEKQRHRRHSVSALGSPPHMRGKACTPATFHLTRRITPAYAGKSAPALRPRILHRDHPRICGEKLEITGNGSEGKGSPPHMRGKAPPDAVRILCGGITPAYAGKSRSHVHHRLIVGDHPRICGEKRSTRRAASRFSGSPPHMRGKD